MPIGGCSVMEIADANLTQDLAYALGDHKNDSVNKSFGENRSGSRSPGPRMPGS